MNIWPPFWGAGIKVVEATDDYRNFKVSLKRTWFNMNYVGTQFGGSIYAMTDPFYMLMIINNLDSNYVVWDKAAQVDFIKPGKTRLTANFKIDQNLIDDIKSKTSGGEKYIFDLPVEVYDEAQVLVAKISKTIYVRLKQKTN